MKASISNRKASTADDEKQASRPECALDTNACNIFAKPISVDSEYEYSDPPSYEEEDEEYEDDLDLILPTSVTESKLFVLPADSFSKTQSEITITSRSAIVDWLLRIFYKVKFQRGTLYNAVYILDRLFSSAFVSADSLQLTSIVCLWISSKVEELIEFKLSSMPIFLSICQNQFTPEQFRTKEIEIFELLNGRMNYPVSNLFLHPLLTAIDSECDAKAAQFYLDLSLMEFEMIGFPAPIVAIAAIAIAMGNRCPIKRLLYLTSFDCSSNEYTKVVAKIVNVAKLFLEKKNTAMYSEYDEGWLKQMKDNAEKSYQYFCGIE